MLAARHQHRMNTRKSLSRGARTGFSRREFISTASALAVSAGAAAVSAGAAEASPGAAGSRVQAGSKGKLPTGKIGKLTVSRLISGGNLISGWAHSRDLHYVPSLMRAYNTEEKVLDTLQLLEEHGVNAIIADPVKKPKEIFARYWKERGGKIQWIAEGHPDMDDWKTNIAAIDRFWRRRRLYPGRQVRPVPQGRPARFAGQMRRVHQVQRRSRRHRRAQARSHHRIREEQIRRGFLRQDPAPHRLLVRPPPRPDSQDVVENRADNYWDLDPRKPSPSCRKCRSHGSPSRSSPPAPSGLSPGFKYAFENGADFICVGMFDFQVEQNVALVRNLLPQMQNRERAWMA